MRRTRWMRLFGPLLLVPVLAHAQTPPDAFLGHRVGEDRRLAGYDRVLDYFRLLDRESPRLQLITIGETVRKRPLVMAVISTEDNLNRLEAIRADAGRLRDARGLAPEKAREIARAGKAVLLVTCSLHADEVGASQMSMELAFDLVAGRTPWDADATLRDVIVLLVPSSNPDGLQDIVDWYGRYVGTPYEGGAMPWLTHPYAGHDNNRDWFMLNLPESRAITRVLYHDWCPQVLIDEHQMDPMAARLFLPPFMDPPLPYVPPVLWRSVASLGTAMALDLQRLGFRGIIQGKRFTGWWIGSCNDTPWLHNVIGLLSETAETRVASPVVIEPREIGAEYAGRSMAQPDPWRGGAWRLRDIVDYELALTLSLIRTVSLRREDLLMDSYLLSRAAVEERAEGQPWAFIIPARQHDGPTALRMIDILLRGGVEVHRAGADFEADGRTYPAGSFVVPTAQPNKAYAWALLDTQEYPDLRLYPGGPPIPPYDNAGWTLPLQMGVTCGRIDTPLDAPLERLEKAPAAEAADGSAGHAYAVLDPGANAAHAVAFALLADGASAWRTTAEDAGLPPGAFLIETSPAVRRALPALLSRFGLSSSGLDDIGGLAKARIAKPRVAIYSSWLQNRDEGWTRYMLDDLGIPYAVLRNEDLRGSKGRRADLLARADVVILADETAALIRSGEAGDGDGLTHFPASLPPEYQGGIGVEGVEALKAFVAGGGRLVALGRACDLVLEEFHPPARNVLASDEGGTFFCPTSILRLEVDNAAPLGYGLPGEAAGVFSKGPVLETRVPVGEWDRAVVARYPEKGVLLSGWLQGEEVVSGRAAVVDLAWKKGRIALIGIRAQHRAQAHGTYKFLLNALLYPER